MKIKSKAAFLAICGMYAALYVVLSVLLSFKIGNFLEISWASLPIIVCGVTMPTGAALSVAVCGSFIEQVLSPYGITATAVIWMLPCIAQALFCGVLKKYADSGVKLAALAAASEILLTLLNIGASYADACLMHYLQYLAVNIPVRLLNGAVRAVLSAVAVPLAVKALKKIVKY